ncbi:hypothetical protein V6N12_076518 [Hibiscus sabdariffa]|uniref:MATH domain-containing protein n=1 Tax=Hibiscus sabdariffa TaxID=183260 RepID=A0ABR2DA17_9ROSI
MNSTFMKWGWNDFLRIELTICERLVQDFYINVTVGRESNLSEGIIRIKSYVMRNDLFICPDRVAYVLVHALRKHVDLQFVELRKHVDSQFTEIRKEMTSLRQEFSTCKTGD